MLASASLSSSLIYSTTPAHPPTEEGDSFSSDRGGDGGWWWWWGGWGWLSFTLIGPRVELLPRWRHGPSRPAPQRWMSRSRDRLLHSKRGPRRPARTHAQHLGDIHHVHHHHHQHQHQQRLPLGRRNNTHTHTLDLNNQKGRQEGDVHVWTRAFFSSSSPPSLSLSCASSSYFFLLRPPKHQDGGVRPPSRLRGTAVSVCVCVCVLMSRLGGPRWCKARRFCRQRVPWRVYRRSLACRCNVRLDWCIFVLTCGDCTAVVVDY